METNQKPRIVVFLRRKVSSILTEIQTLPVETSETRKPEKSPCYESYALHVIWLSSECTYSIENKGCLRLRLFLVSCLGELAAAVHIPMRIRMRVPRPDCCCTCRLRSDVPQEKAFSSLQQFFSSAPRS